MTIRDLISAYQSNRKTPAEVIRETYARIRDKGERPVWIHLVPEEEAIERAMLLGSYRDNLPLFGVPFAIKDNLDLVGTPTTAGCPEFSYTPAKSATVVQKLIDAGAIAIGKTNLDQFATGLVGVRSPYGACSSVFDERYISGGSSSGSAIAVAAGLVAFSLGTDTAGSGRVPASFNGIVGMKPTRGALSTAGVVPACRTLDCVSIFANSCEDAALIQSVAQGFDESDAYSRPAGQPVAWSSRGFGFGAPRPDQLEFFGDESARALFDRAADRLRELGGRQVEFDYAPFRDAAQLLYSGPWLAERFAAIREFIEGHPDALHPVTAKIIRGGERIGAADAFTGMYELQRLARVAESQWRGMDVMLLPTAGAAYTHEEIAREPIELNTQLGYYTNFVNLLDLAAVAVPAGIRSNGMPFGVSLIGPAWSDAALLELGERFGSQLPARMAQYCPNGYVPLAVCGAHLSGQPLNHQLAEAGAFLIESTLTAPEYRLFALQGTVPAKPGLLLQPNGGTSIEVEVWAVPQARFGGFVAGVPSPLAIGNCKLANGRLVKSFVCEPIGFSNALDISHLGGWRPYVSSLASVDKVAVQPG